MSRTQNWDTDSPLISDISGVPVLISGQQERIDELTKRLNSVVAELHDCDAHPGISNWVSNEEALRCRKAAAAGDLETLQAVAHDRERLPKVLILASWDIPDNLGCTALLLAVEVDAIPCIEFLLDCGESASGSCDSRREPHTHMDAFVGSNPNCSTDEEGRSALHLARSKRSAELLLQRGANPAAIDHMQVRRLRHLLLFSACVR
eukprot:SAG31_NODE_1003_length_10447_cov_3.491593_5_plen_206_part_00